MGVAWEVEFTDEFQDWWDAFSEAQQDDVAHPVRHLIEFGPALGPLRTLYAFNPLRTAILLIGGDKTGDDRWYARFVPIADRLFERHLGEPKKEGRI
jgi:hypothetical protein